METTKMVALMEDTLQQIDSLLCLNTLGEIDDAEALDRIGRVMNDFTDPGCKHKNTTPTTCLDCDRRIGAHETWKSL